MRGKGSAVVPDRHLAPSVSLLPCASMANCVRRPSLYGLEPLGARIRSHGVSLRASCAKPAFQQEMCIKQSNTGLKSRRFRDVAPVSSEEQVQKTAAFYPEKEGFRLFLDTKTQIYVLPR